MNYPVLHKELLNFFLGNMQCIYFGVHSVSHDFFFFFFLWQISSGTDVNTCNVAHINMQKKRLLADSCERYTSKILDVQIKKKPQNISLSRLAVMDI